MEHEEYTYTYGMDEATVADRLRASETGVLALARDGDAYAIPIAHEYEDGRLFLRMGVREGSRKVAFAEDSGEVTFVVYDDDPLDEAWSVVVEGRLRELDEAEQENFDAMRLNEAFAPIRVFDEDVEDLTEVIYELEIESVTGRTAAP